MKKSEDILKGFGLSNDWRRVNPSKRKLQNWKRQFGAPLDVRVEKMPSELGHQISITPEAFIQWIPDWNNWEKKGIELVSISLSQKGEYVIVVRLVFVHVDTNHPHNTKPKRIWYAKRHISIELGKELRIWAYRAHVSLEARKKKGLDERRKFLKKTKREGFF